MARYTDAFFAERHARTAYAARRILAIVFDVLPGVRSAVDIGCGVGTWLSVAGELGAGDVAGVDGPWVDVKHLAIPSGRFTHHHLDRDFDFGRRFDLAISLEVAEHLHPPRAPGFVAWLANLSDFVLFSAAIPLQGGRNHYNEQWQSWWARQFADRGMVPVDCVRPLIWDDERIATWYRQNILLYVREDRLAEVRAGRASGPLDIVHPDVYCQKLQRAATLGGAFKAWRGRLRGRRPAQRRASSS